MIHPKSGHIILDDGQAILPLMHLKTIQLMNLGERQSLKETGANWTRYEVKNVKIGAHYFLFSFLLENNYLKTISFILQKEPFDLEQNDWSNWSEQNELEKLAYYNNCLDNMLAKQRAFKWGNIAASYDKKGGGSSILLSYHDHS